MFTEILSLTVLDRADRADAALVSTVTQADRAVSSPVTATQIANYVAHTGP